MEQRKLTGTGLTAPRVCLGTMIYGGQLDEAASLELLAQAFELGISFLDTANSYNAGYTEEIVGKAIKGRRNELILASKCRFAVGERPNDSGLSRKHILQACEDSLRRLQTDYLDIYYMHAPDHDCPIEESMEAFTRLMAQGKIRYAAVSNFASWQVTEMKWISKTYHYTPPVCNQVPYNLLQRDIEQELLPCAAKYRLGIAIYNPLAGGLLSGKYQLADRPESGRFSEISDYGSKYRERYWDAARFQMVDALAQLAAQAGLSLLELALRWCVSQQQVDTIILGASRLAQLQENLRLLDQGPLSEDLLRACDQIHPGSRDGRFQYNR